MRKIRNSVKKEKATDKSNKRQRIYVISNHSKRNKLLETGKTVTKIHSGHTDSPLTLYQRWSMISARNKTPSKFSQKSDNSRAIDPSLPMPLPLIDEEINNSILNGSRTSEDALEKM